MTPPSDTAPSGPVSVPLVARIHLGHAVVQAIADDAGIDVLHIKGYAVERDLYPAHRSSTDVDVLVRPSQAARLVAALAARGWERRTTFRSGSIFEHAAVHWHSTWGYVDVHRVLPGIGLPAEAAFERFWTSRGTARIAGLECVVPSRAHQMFVVVLHDARDPGETTFEVEHLRGLVSDDERAWLRAEARAFDAEIAWAAATGRLDEFRGHPEFPLWDALRRGAGRGGLLIARTRSARGLGARARILVGAALPNQDHLRMTLGHQPGPADYGRDIVARVRDAAREVARRLRGTADGAR